MAGLTSTPGRKVGSSVRHPSQIHRRLGGVLQPGSRTVLDASPTTPRRCKGDAVTKYGVLGVGSIATSIVTGLCEGLADPPTVMLSPRNRGRAAELAHRYGTVSVAPSNQAVVDAGEVVIVCLLPEDADEVLGSLTFTAGQAVVSAMAGVSLARLRELVRPATDIERSVPLPAVSARDGVTPTHPGTSAGIELFGRLGGVWPIPDEHAYEALSVASATVGAFFNYLGAVTDWLAEQGIGRSPAQRFVADLFAGLSPEMRSVDVDFADLAAAHSTTGGLNEQFARHMQSAGTDDAVRRGLEALLERIADE